MAKLKTFSLPEVARHSSRSDCWLIIEGRVLNVTKFLEDHPGGEEVLVELAGKDATKQFTDIGHSKAAEKMLMKYQVGSLPDCGLEEKTEVNETSSFEQEPDKKKEMSAFVLNDEPKAKYAAFMEFFVPMLVAGTYLGYTCMTQ